MKLARDKRRPTGAAARLAAEPVPAPVHANGWNWAENAPQLRQIAGQFCARSCKSVDLHDHAVVRLTTFTSAMTIPIPSPLECTP